MLQVYRIELGPMGFVSEEMCHMSALRGVTRLSVTVQFAQVEGTHFGQELMQQIELWKGQEWGMIRDKPVVNLVWQHCLPLFKQLAPQTALEDLRLENFLQTPNFYIRAVNGAGDDIRFEGTTQCRYEPVFFTLPIRTSDLPEACDRIPHIKAEDISIAPILRDGESIDAIQGRVVTADGRSYYFKPRVDMREVEFERELQVLLRIRNTGLADQLRVPRLEGIVVSGENTIGMLINLINGTHLRSSEHIVRHDLHMRWEVQLKGIVQELHAHDIVWGDVHPMNMMIDTESNAWAIDFGGMNNAEFVDRENRETIEGDWQGLRRTFEDWLPNQQ
ncbi:hypothetical protein OPT61_g3888 [Boeremia exigua]|uniref:Uncharacterized protein n=1 Tax=Boeremia exigua TaxID=749465 RepID=A0ACC2IG56_9PLEO|nr:hypothetical protein OPT61_g3888 [Boeremia exigua]